MTMRSGEPDTLVLRAREQLAESRRVGRVRPEPPKSKAVLEGRRWFVQLCLNAGVDNGEDKKSFNDVLNAYNKNARPRARGQWDAWRAIGWKTMRSYFGTYDVKHVLKNYLDDVLDCYFPLTGFTWPLIRFRHSYADTMAILEAREESYRAKRAKEKADAAAALATEATTEGDVVPAVQEGDDGSGGGNKADSEKMGVDEEAAGKQQGEGEEEKRAASEHSEHDDDKKSATSGGDDDEGDADDESEADDSEDDEEEEDDDDDEEEDGSESSVGSVASSRVDDLGGKACLLKQEFYERAADLAEAPAGRMTEFQEEGARLVLAALMHAYNGGIWKTWKHMIMTAGSTFYRTNVYAKFRDEKSVVYKKFVETLHAYGGTLPPEYCGGFYLSSNAPSDQEPSVHGSERDADYDEFKEESDKESDTRTLTTVEGEEHEDEAAASEHEDEEDELAPIKQFYSQDTLLDEYYSDAEKYAGEAEDKSVESDGETPTIVKGDDDKKSVRSVASEHKPKKKQLQTPEKRVVRKADEHAKTTSALAVHTKQQQEEKLQVGGSTPSDPYVPVEFPIVSIGYITRLLQERSLEPLSPSELERQEHQQQPHVSGSQQPPIAEQPASSATGSAFTSIFDQLPTVRRFKSNWPQDPKI